MFNKRSVLEIVTFIAVFIAIVVTLSTWNYPQKIVLAGKTFTAEVVDTKALLEKGLSGHAPLSSDRGMLFVFQKPDKYSFWMKDMTFPIDMLWIDSNFRIIHIEKSVSPDTYPKAFSSELPALYVLEISAGQSNLLNVKIGDTVVFLK